MSEEFVSVTEAGEIAGLTRSHILNLCHKGRLKGAQKVGKTWIIPRREVEEYKPSPKGFAVMWERKRAASLPSVETKA